MLSVTVFLVLSLFITDYIPAVKVDKKLERVAQKEEPDIEKGETPKKLSSRKIVGELHFY